MYLKARYILLIRTQPAALLRIQTFFIQIFTSTLYSLSPKLPPHRKQAFADSKRESKMTKTNFTVAHITEL
jgi:hypothetical protein